MRIGEIAEKTGLSISNIRFYEKKGLIGPNREEDSKYRNYTEADLERLKLIILYRKMDISVEVIGKILENEISVEDVLEQQLIDLKIKQQMLQSSIDLCQKIIDDQAFETVDVNYYLDYVKEEESKGRIFGKIDDFIEDFSSFTNFNKYVGGSYLGWWLFSKPWMNRAVMILWSVFLMMVPIIGIVDDMMDDNGPSPTIIVFWILWMVLFTVSFIRFRRSGRDDSL